MREALSFSYVYDVKFTNLLWNDEHNSLIFIIGLYISYILICSFIGCVKWAKGGAAQLASARSRL